MEFQDFKKLYVIALTHCVDLLGEYEVILKETLEDDIGWQFSYLE